jgi:hypothetical protein
MKIVESLWSKPASSYGGLRRYNGRWPEPKFYWYSWVISVGWAHRHYGNVELVTDNAGARWLVDTLKLPFTSVRTELESFDLPGWMWAAGKIVAYSLQEEPFFHIDNDAYLAGRLPDKYEKADLVCQLVERGTSYPGFHRIYDETVQVIEQRIKRLPTFWKYTRDQCAANCSICGGQNLGAMLKYASDVLKLITDPDNVERWRKHFDWKAAANCVLEQQTLWCSAKEQGVELTPLFEEEDFQHTESLRRKTLATNFNHAALDGKNAIFGEHLGERVEIEFPEQFKIINDLFPRTYAQLAMPTVIYDEDGTAQSSISQIEIRYPRGRRGTDRFEGDSRSTS